MRSELTNHMVDWIRAILPDFWRIKLVIMSFVTRQFSGQKIWNGGWVDDGKVLSL